MLDQGDFNTIIRLLRRGDIHVVSQLRTVAFNKLKELKVNRETSHAVRTTPKGSDQVDVQSIIHWINKIVPGDSKAIEQLVAIDATAVDRS